MRYERLKITLCLDLIFHKTIRKFFISKRNAIYIILIVYICIVHIKKTGSSVAWCEPVSLNFYNMTKVEKTMVKLDIKNNVKLVDGMVSLTDLWKQAGSPNTKRPIDWQKKESTIEFIEALSLTFRSGKIPLLKTKRGKGAGTYGHKSIALAYSKYLDPKLHVLVNEVFFERIEEEKSPDLIVDRAIKTYQNKGLSPEWISKRLNAKGVRNEFTSTLARHGVNGEGFKLCTNAMYLPLFGTDAKGVRGKKGLPDKANIRENMSLLELQAISFAETLAKENIENNGLYGNQECANVSNKAARVVRESINKFRSNNHS